MQVLHKSCCGLDVHKKSITACVITPKGKEVRTFRTMTSGLFELVHWISSHKCTHVAMESTGVLWKPVFNLLEMQEGLTVYVVNAQHIKAVPGRKTDVKDAEWIANLLRHGLVTPSYIPSRDQRELRELIRYRRSLIEERSRELNRVQKVLEGGNIKLSSVASNVMGVSGRAMIEAMISGVEDPVQLADLAQKKLKRKKDDLIEALQGIMGPHQRLMLQHQLKHIDQLDELIEELDNEIDHRMAPHEDDIQRLDTIPGVGRATAQQILAEIGFEVEKQFQSAERLCSWSGLTPGNNQSGGKRKTEKTRRGNKKLRYALVEAARAASRTKGTYLSSMYRRIAARRGANRAAVAVGHAILKIAYYLMVRKETYKELGEDYFDQRRREIVLRQSLKRLESLGYSVSLDAVT